MLASLVSPLLVALAVSAPPVPQPVDWTVAPHEGSGGRVLFAPEAPLLELAGDPDWTPPFTERVKADGDGRVETDTLRNGWAFCAYEAAEAGTVLVDGRGFHSFFVNGDRYAGDFYRHGFLRQAVPLRKGTNRILVRAIRGGFTMRFAAAEGRCSLAPGDATLPDLRRGRRLDSHGAVVVLNHTGEPLADAVLEVGDGRVFARELIPVRTVLPHGATKAVFPLTQIAEPDGSRLDGKGRYRLPVTLRSRSTQYTTLYPMDVRAPGEAYRETRISTIDGSVQEHAVRPPIRVEEGREYALYLSLHGAGVPCLNQARAYAAKPDAFVVAPTNRRRFGFDWQDWGRLDALEALEHALAEFPVDESRVHLTGHSMGGHGTWYLGSLYPHRFAAIAPSAGWASFFTYGGGMLPAGGDRLEPFRRTQIENDPLLFLRNLERTPVYILQGEKDDNVPADQPRRIIEKLEVFHRDFVYHEQPGAGHWWGRECVDWPPLFDFCRRHRRVAKPHRFSFRTFNPAVSARFAWATIETQERSGDLSRIEVEADPRAGTVEVSTENVLTFTLDLRGLFPGDRAKIVVDGVELEREADWWWVFTRAYGDRWADAGGSTERDDPRVWKHYASKSGRLAGPFKLAFANDMVWVYGTRGTPEENAATLAKVRYDSLVWWYRGNGAPAILRDRDFAPGRFEGRNVILYGNEETNGAWKKLLPDSPVVVARDRVSVGERRFDGDLGALFVRPSGGRLVGAVGMTSARAGRMMQQARYFVSGSAVPDWVVFGDEVLMVGMEGVAAAGYFEHDWSLSGEE